MNDPHRRIWRSQFWWRWVAANALAELLGLGTVAGLGFLAIKHFGEPGSLSQALAFAAAFSVLGALEGAVVGVAQRSVLRTRLPALRGWVWSTIAGAMAAWAVGMVPSTVASVGQSAGTSPPVQPPLALVLLLAAALGAVAGPLLAAFQWLSLRKVVAGKAWLWLPANAAAWACGMPVIFLGAQANALTSNPAVIAAVVGLALLAAGAVVGAVHGWALLQLITPLQPAENAA